MESQIEVLSKRLHEAAKETKTLYDISEAEEIILMCVVRGASEMRLSTKLIVRMLKAAAHLIETCNEITDDFFKENK